MAIFRVEKIRDYTVMSNHHLKNKELSLKAKGLLSLILSLPNDWDFTMRGLAAISVEGVDAIRQAIVELEKQGYVVRSRVRDSKGHLRGAEYVIYEQPGDAQQPQTGEVQPAAESPAPEASTREIPTRDIPAQDSTTQLIPNREKTYPSNTLNKANPYPSIRSHTPLRGAENQPDGMDGMSAASPDQIRQEIHERIAYDILSQDGSIDKGRLDEAVQIVAEVLCAGKGSMSIAGREYDISFVQDRMRQINSQHIRYAFECLDDNHSHIRNIKSYLLTVLFNATATMESYYAAKVNQVATTIEMDELPE